MDSFIPAEGAYPQTYMADQSTQQIPELQFDKFHTFNIFMLVDWIQDPSKCLFQFSLGGNVMDQRCGDGRFSALNSGLHSFPEYWDAGREDCVCSEQDHPELLLQEKGQSGGTESSDRFHDLRPLLGYWWVTFMITLIYFQSLFAMIYVQEFDSRWDEIL